MSNPKKHHYIPKFYLKSWSDKPKDMKPKVSAYIKTEDGLINHVKSIEDLCAKNGLNTFIGVSGEISQNMEKLFFTEIIDTLAAEIYRKILEKGINTLNAEENGVWQRFIVSILVRNPEMIDETQKKALIVLKEEIRKAPDKEYLNYLLSALENDEIIASGIFGEGIPIKNNFGMISLADAIMSEDKFGRIKNLKYFAVRSINSSLDFITSDRPVITNVQTDNQGNNYPYLVTMPLSPKKVFFAASSKEILNHFINLHTDQRMVKEINRGVVQQSKRFVIGNSNIDFVAKNFAINPKNH